MPTIVVADTDFDDISFEQRMIEAAGITFEGYSETRDRNPQRVIEHLRHADGAIASYATFDASVFEACPNLKVVSKTGTGVDNVDVEAASQNGTAVCNVVGYGTEVVSDHAIALALAVLRRICEMDASMRKGVWNFHSLRPLGQVSGRTFGVVGMGNIGRAVARKAKGLGFNVIVWSRSATPGTLTPEGFPCVSLEDVLKQSDVVSFHTALTAETHHLLNEDNIRLMKKDAVVVNTSRGAVIDNDAVARALQEGRLWGAGIDVFEHEPVSPDALIYHAPHTVLTPHAAYWSEEAAVELRTRCTQNAINVVLGKEPENCVNPEVLAVALAK